MKKILSVLIITVTVLVSFASPVVATTTSFLDDGAALIYESDREIFEAKLSEYAAHYGIGLYIVTVSDAGVMAGRTTEEYAIDFVETYQVEARTPDSLTIVLDYVNLQLQYHTTGDGHNIFTTATTDMITMDVNDFTGTDHAPLFEAMISRAAAAASDYTGLTPPDSIVAVASGEYRALIDNADLFTAEEEEMLIARINEINEKYNFDYTALTVTDNGTYYDLVEYADNFRGLDDAADGVVFARNITTREYATSARGYGEVAFTYPDAFDRIDDIVVPFLKNDETFDAYMAHIDFTEELLESAYNGEVYTSPWYDQIEWESVMIAGAVGVAVSLMLAFGITGGMISAMKTAVKQTNARNYVRSGSFRLFDNRDIFIREFTTKTKIQSSSGGGGGGGSSSNSFGGSRTSRGGRA